MIIFNCGCAMFISDRTIRKSFSDKADFSSDMHGKVEFVNNGYFNNLSDSNFVEDPTKWIIKDYESSGKKIISDENTILRFTYNKCEVAEGYPASNQYVNYVIRIFTIAIVPTGDVKKCNFKLEVLEKNNVIKSYNTDVEYKDLVSLMFQFTTSSNAKTSLNYPARQLIKMYQTDSAK